LILILSDINMPGMSGLELLPKAKAARPDVPVIMITAYGDADTKRKALEGGAEALLTKPIDFVTLRSEIDSGSEALDSRPVPHPRDVVRWRSTFALVGLGIAVPTRTSSSSSHDAISSWEGSPDHAARTRDGTACARLRTNRLR
jgi:DNA-binding response OmpR family regulator